MQPSTDVSRREAVEFYADILFDEGSRPAIDALKVKWGNWTVSWGSSQPAIRFALQAETLAEEMAKVTDNVSYCSAVRKNLKSRAAKLGVKEDDPHFKRAMELLDPKNVRQRRRAAEARAEQERRDRPIREAEARARRSEANKKTIQEHPTFVNDADTYDALIKRAEEGSAKVLGKGGYLYTVVITPSRDRDNDFTIAGIGKAKSDDDLPEVLPRIIEHFQAPEDEKFDLFTLLENFTDKLARL